MENQITSVVLRKTLYDVKITMVGHWEMSSPWTCFRIHDNIAIGSGDDCVHIPGGESNYL